jgi:hypothetical protein
MVALLPALALKAQILNIDKTDTSNYTHTTKVAFSGSSGLEIDKQKATLYDATNPAEIMVQHYKELFIASVSYRFTYNGPDDILNAGYVHVRYRHNYKNILQPEPFAQYQWDNKRGILYRALAGINARYNITRGDKVDFNCGLGLMYETEKWDYTAVDSEKIPVNAAPYIVKEWVKINAYLRLNWKPNDNNDVVFNLFLQTVPNRFKPRIAPHAQWTIQAGKHVGFMIAFTGLYDTAPVVPIEKFYYSLSNGIQLNF